MIISRTPFRISFLAAAQTIPHGIVPMVVLFWLRQLTNSAISPAAIFHHSLSINTVSIIQKWNTARLLMKSCIQLSGR